MNDRQRVKISKFLSLVLRHRPQTVGVTLDAAGWVSVAALLDGCAQSGLCTMTESRGGHACRAATDAHCKRSSDCKDRRKCTAAGGFCR